MTTDKNLHNSLRDNHRRVCTGLLSTMMLLLISCRGEQPYVYDEQADVQETGWSRDDTLWYQAEVLDEPRYAQPLQALVQYQIHLSVRHTQHYAYCELPLTILVQQVDTTGGLPYRPIPVEENDSIRIWTAGHYHTALPLSADGHTWQGQTWGSLCQSLFHLQKVHMQFPHTGYYRIGVVQQTPDSLVTGICSVGIELGK